VRHFVRPEASRIQALRRRTPSPPARDPAGVRRRGPLWRLGLLAAALALATQVSLLLAPMPWMARGDGNPALALAVLSGSDLPCHSDAAGPAGKGGRPHPLAQHDCPICQTLLQTAAFLAPAVVEAAALPLPAAGPAVRPRVDRPAPPLPSQIQPRAPPAIA
jgi:hypothetical protein